MLIVEGADNVGKTTFLKAVQKVLWSDYCEPCVYQHFGVLPPCWDFWEHYHPYITKHTLMDRFIMSELVYGTVVRGECKIKPQHYRMLDGMLAAIGSMTVVITADDAVVEQQYKLCGDEHFKGDTIRRVNELYHRIIGGDDQLTIEPMWDKHYHLEPREDGSLNWPAENESFVRMVAHEWHTRLRLLCQSNAQAEHTPSTLRWSASLGNSPG